ncbi:MAG: zf-HC2 domain-containing protein [Planctomycetes bacterium]|nr:zf-HC2 domain-containing protein [Planctomycetota bacterium]
MTMTCNEALPLVWSYLDGELSEAQAAPLRKHLLECHGCRNSAQHGKTLKRWFVRSAADEVAPRGFAARVAQQAFAAHHAARAAEASEYDEVETSAGASGEREDGRVFAFVLRLTAIAAVALFVLSLVLRFQALPATSGLRADQRAEPTLEEVKRGLEELNAKEAARARPVGHATEQK